MKEFFKEAWSIFPWYIKAFGSFVVLCTTAAMLYCCEDDEYIDEEPTGEYQTLEEMIDAEMGYARTHQARD